MHAGLNALHTMLDRSDRRNEPVPGDRRGEDGNAEMVAIGAPESG